nr:Chain A, Major capsid protein [Bacillus phage SPP1]6R3A_B Chain B, Major capsid protein [Bacillus phage SPP1]6R3A_C Chain C, Major capsid protein [Bacillus phage SPP1]6R3A_D Chain D, Major capsid protein [Bacillus phage SPP1]6R3A_E Chain E, Major capsid protein [Bacillus phage SPP1]6R3A_F Chain F, Major capsid protein [Bacillus phage SPP1]6R3A_G Chain G, Major capsid protein [Bacillus phage SPP1]6R3B_A Chain A, Major capsid protein [Bacillus phage SPP1]6R3B_B Chain B, Major capsid protei
AYTKISDVIVPELFNPYVINTTTQLSAFFQSGIAATDDELNALAKKAGGGSTLNMPYWNDLDGDSQVLNDTDDLVPQKINAGQDKAVLILRGNAWSSHDLAATLSGSDPMQAIGSRVAAYWAREMQKIVFAELAGVFSNDDMKDNKLDISGTADGIYSAETFVDASYKLGDHESLLTAIGMHSATMASAVKQDLIEFVKDSQSGIRFPTYMNKRVIVDDSMPVETLEDGTKVFTSYLFGAGALGYAEGQPEVPTETARNALGSQDILINRKHFVLHPRGVKFTENAMAGTTPTDEELANGANWQRVYDPKKIRIVQFKHRLQA